jgi:flagellar L-ring protein precursor FlgH
MMKNALILIVCIFASTGTIYAQSLWNGETQSPLDDPRTMPFNKHDLIQILVIEKSAGSAKANLNTDKWTRLDSKSGFTTPTGNEVSLEGSTNSRLRKDNIGSTVREFELTITVTAEVVEILPNGHLVIEAKKSRKINDEVERIKLTGVVAPIAVINNTVRSEKIADLKIEYDGKGSIGDHQKPGFLGWLLSQFWPF